jgi:hypothetical protein
MKIAVAGQKLPTTQGADHLFGPLSGETDGRKITFNFFVQKY